MYLGSWKIDDNLTFYANTHDPDTGVATDADSVPTYRVYEDETATPILTGSMALLDAANTAGFYSEQIALSAANGFEKGKCYSIYITATVDSDEGTMHHFFQVEAEVDANTVSASNVSANVQQIEGADPTDTIRDAVVDDATRIDASSLNAIEAKIDTIDGIVDDILTDTGTTLDGIVDAILVDTGTTLNDKIDTIDGIVDDILTDTGTTLDGIVDAILVDTGTTLDDKIDTIDGIVDDILTDTGTTLPTAAAIADAVWDEALAGHDTEDTIGNVLNDLVEESGTYRFTTAALAQAPDDTGAGAITFTYTLTSSADASAIINADVWVTSDLAGTTVLASGTTDANGQVTFYLDAGTVYVWRQKSGWDFTNPDTETVS